MYDQNTMSNRVLIACGVIAAATVGFFVRARRRNGSSSEISNEVELETSRLPTVEIDDDEAAEIISRARPALDRAAKLL
jgi:hypothetical protein